MTKTVRAKASDFGLPSKTLWRKYVREVPEDCRIEIKATAAANLTCGGEYCELTFKWRSDND